jgi:tRNA1Val (adenine37-N6)-methyltransferase
VSCLDLYVRPDEQCASLTRDWFLLQRRKGHRYSVDDLLVAQVAASCVGTAGRVLDLGCGIGSVLLMVGWALPHAKLVGIEAQQESLDLARRNVALNDCGDRVELVGGDLRDVAMLQRLGAFDLVTGTPPYFDPKAATPCADAQRAHAKFELRGGIEDYARAAARTLAAFGTFVVCAPAQPPGRGLEAIRGAGLHARSMRPVLPGPGRAPFLELIVAGPEPCELELHPALLLREGDGRRAEEHARIREWFGLTASVW